MIIDRHTVRNTGEPMRISRGNEGIAFCLYRIKFISPESLTCRENTLEQK
jgi:hypothetical protein